MSYKYNQLAGRLVGAAKSLGTGLKPAGPESKIIYNHDVKFSKIPTETTGSSGSRGNSKYAPLSPKLIAKYQEFQEPNDIPVHLKGGITDRIMLAGILVMTGYGLFESFSFFYTLVYPKKPE